MKLTELRIAPELTWKSIGSENPLRAVVKLNSENSTVECVLSEETMRKMLDLCADEIAKEAERQVREFRAAVMTIDVEKSAALIGGD